MTGVADAPPPGGTRGVPQDPYGNAPDNRRKAMMVLIGVGVAVVAVAAVLVLQARNEESRPSASSTSTTVVRPPSTSVPVATTAPSTTETLVPTAVDAFTLAAGDCFDDPDEAEVSEVVTRPCDGPHDNEVYLVAELDDGPDARFPGVAAIATQVEDRCVEAFDAFVGTRRVQSSLGLFTLGPTADSWEQGDRELLCAVFDPDGPLPASAEGSGR